MDNFQAGHLDEVTIGLAKRLARSLVGYAGLTRSDIDDITHDLLQRLLVRSAAFNPDRGHWRPFAAKVLVRQAASLLRDARAKKRDRRRVTSLNRTVGNLDGRTTELAELVSTGRQPARARASTRSPEELAQLALDIRDATDLLPMDLRDLTQRLMHNCVAFVARDMGVSRAVVYAGIRRIRQIFEDAGLRDYLA